MRQKIGLFGLLVGMAITFVACTPAEKKEMVDIRKAQ